MKAINVEEAWASNVTGAGVTVMIADDGVDASHPDLAKLSVADSCDHYLPASEFDTHGTQCAALAVGSSNDHCGVGVAHGASLASCKIYGWGDTEDELYAGFAKGDVISNSWNYPDSCIIPKGGFDAMKAGITDGRGGKGIVYVFAAGNEYTGGGNTNFEGYLHSRYTITVGAVGMDVLHASYSSTGASVFVSAPGGDSGDVLGMVTAFPVATGTSCRNAGSGTSFATPIVSGVAALMLEANPNLGWRDVQGIIATTSKLPDDDGDLPRSVNAAGIGHSYQYGFGIIDAGAAVAAARTWQNYYTETVLTAMASPGAAIADDGAAVSSTISAAADADFEVETVVVVLTIDHPHRGDLRIILERDGVESLLAPESDEDGDGYADWKYTTVRHWGESANGGGGWTLKV
ncbi:hypothetical protein AURANDRAFT_18780, partial [Aureococcus anophagefferens]